MTARVVVTATEVRVARESLRWALTPVRLLESGVPGWRWVLPAVPAAVMERAAEQVSDGGSALLLTVGAFRSELQVWRDERRVLLVSWEPGRGPVLSREEAVRGADELAAVVSGVDVRAIALLLAAPRPGVGAWRDLVAELRVPLPPGFPAQDDAEALAGQGEVVSATGLWEASGLREEVAGIADVARLETRETLLPTLRWTGWVLLGAIVAARLVVAVRDGSAAHLVVAALAAVLLVGWRRRRAGGSGESDVTRESGAG